MVYIIWSCSTASVVGYNGTSFWYCCFHACTRRRQARTHDVGSTQYEFDGPFIHLHLGEHVGICNPSDASKSSSGNIHHLYNHTFMQQPQAGDVGAISLAKEQHFLVHHQELDVLMAEGGWAPPTGQTSRPHLPNTGGPPFHDVEWFLLGNDVIKVLLEIGVLRAQARLDSTHNGALCLAKPRHVLCWVEPS